MSKSVNLWQLLAQDATRPSLMRACGVAEDTLQNGSDYDRFAAYADCIPLCRGHAILQADVKLIKDLLGVPVPICPQSADALWHAAAYVLNGTGDPALLPEIGEIAFETFTAQTLRCTDLGQAFFAFPTAELLMRLLDPDVQGVCVSARMQSFVKPNPYTAKRLYETPSDRLTDAERDHLSVQTLRVLGKLCAERGSAFYVESDFADMDAWRAVLAYLQQSGCLSQIVLIARTADALRAAANLAGCLPNPTDAPTVRVGVANVPQREDLLDLYQTLLPIGMLPPQI